MFYNICLSNGCRFGLGKPILNPSRLSIWSPNKHYVFLLNDDLNCATYLKLLLFITTLLENDENLLENKMMLCLTMRLLLIGNIDWKTWYHPITSQTIRSISIELFLMRAFKIQSVCYITDQYYRAQTEQIGLQVLVSEFFQYCLYNYTTINGGHLSITAIILQ